MLYIHKGERSRLHSQYRPINNLCAIIYDQLTEIFKGAHYKQLTTTDIPIDKKRQIRVEEFQNGKLHAFDWLAENKLDKELTIVLTKHVCPSGVFIAELV